MSFLIDADVVSAHLRGRGSVTSRFLQHMGRLHMSAVTLAELKTWLHRHNTPERYRQGFALLMTDFVLLAVDEAVADCFGELGAKLLDQGQTVATPDLLIAATALVHDLTLVTGNVRHFEAIEELRIGTGCSNNWIAIPTQRFSTILLASRKH